MLLLFDIDGTLTTGGPARPAFRHALRGAYGTAGPIANHDFSGKTDPLIMRELLAAAGLSPREIEAGRPTFRDLYAAELEARIGAEPVTVLPGVRELIGALEARPDMRLGLVTGNVEAGARLKLRSAGLWRRFAVGAFGSDHEDRNRLPPIALRRAAERWGRPFEGRDAVIIGDTPRDVECGKAAGAATLAVATGGFSEGELLDAGADAALPGFGDADAALEALEGLRRRG